MASARFAVFVLLLSSAVLFFLSGSTWIRRKNAGSPAKWLSLCMSGAAIYCFGYAMELSSGTLPEMMSWIRFQHLGIQVLAPTWLLFSLHISGRQNLITTSRLFVFLSIPLFLFFSAQTLGGLNLFHLSPRIVTSGPFPFFTYDRGLVAWISVTYLTFCVTASTFIFSVMYLGSTPLFRRQVMLFILGSLIPWIAMIIYMFKAAPQGLDLNPFALSLSGVIFSLALFRYRLLDIVPLARDVIFENMGDGVLVADNRGRMIDFNPAAGRMIPEIDRNSIGSPLKEIMAPYPELILHLDDDPAESIDIRISRGEITKYYKCSVSLLTGANVGSAGRIIIFSDISRIRHLMDQLEEQAALDGLTGVYNRRHFTELAVREIYRFHRFGGALSMIMLDLDHFKNINDSFGHSAGDAVLKAASKTLEETIRKTDIIGRFGGEEFIILLPETGPDSAAELAEKLRDRLERLAVSFQDRTFNVTASFGVTGVVSPDKTSLEELFECADRALYEAKTFGRNRVVAS